jgi:hypothetical protein
VGESIPLEKVRQRRSRIAQRLNVRPKVRFASSLAAALLDDLFDQPAGFREIVWDFWISCFAILAK